MSQWNVLLQYPDYLDSDQGLYYTHPDGETVDEAIAEARTECLAALTDEDGDCGLQDQSDLRVLLVTEGYAPDRKYEAAEYRSSPQRNTP
jgi:hypothetical protein